MNNILEYLYCAIYVICLTITLITCLNEEYTFKRLIPLICVYSFINYIITGAYANNFLEFLIINFFVLFCDFIYCCMLFKDKQWYYLFYTTLYFCLYGLYINIMVQLSNLLMNYQVIHILSFSIQRSIIVIFVNIFALTNVWIIKYFNIIPKIYVLKQAIQLFNGLNCLILCMFSVGYNLNTEGIIRHMTIIILGLLIIWLGSLKLINNYVITKIKNDELMIREISNNYIAKYIDFYLHESEKIKQIKHDLKNHRIILENINKSNIYNKYIDNIFGEIDNSYINTGNVFIDSCLYAKQQEYPNINFEYDIAIKGLTMNNKDITTLLFNLMDNACYAALMADNRVYLKLRYEANVLKICVKNKYIGRLNLYSSKGEEHGYGLQIIENIIRRYDGDFFINDQQNTIIFNISITV